MAIIPHRHFTLFFTILHSTISYTAVFILYFPFHSRENLQSFFYDSINSFHIHVEYMSSPLGIFHVRVRKNFLHELMEHKKKFEYIKICIRDTRFGLKIVVFVNPLIDVIH